MSFNSRNRCMALRRREVTSNDVHVQFILKDLSKSDRVVI